MPMIWKETKNGWAAVDLTAAGGWLADVLGPDDPGPDSDSQIIGFRELQSGRVRWALLDSAGEARRARLNGRPLGLRLRVLRDRDAIGVGNGRTLFFSADRPAIVEAIAAHAVVVMCGRCQTPIGPGSAAVRCPECSTWHHESPELGCWSHVERCSICSRSTAAGEFGWTPLEL
jgi:hypothetical protein